MPNAVRLSRAMLAQDAETVARSLLGMRLVRDLGNGDRRVGRIVETEAYLGVRDRAAHSFKGHRSARNESMYQGAGTCYVYFTYGMHHCVNVVCGAVDEPIAVLIRALEPVEGTEAMRASRTRARRLSDRALCSGPAKLCQALQIDRALDGTDLVTGTGLYLSSSETDPIPSRRVRRTARVGIPNAGDWSNRRLRWLIRDSEHVSTHREIAYSGG